MQMWLPYYAASLPHCHICIVATDIMFTYCIATWLYKIQSGKHANSMCTLVPSSATDCGNYQSLETVVNSSEKKQVSQMKKNVWGYYYVNSVKNQFASFKSVYVATISFIQ